MADSEKNPILKLIHSGVFVLITIECILLFAPLFENNILRQIIKAIDKLELLKFPYVKFYELVLVFLIVIGGKPLKKVNVNITKEIIIPTIVGGLFFALTFVVIEKAVTVPNTLFTYFNEYSLVYIIASFLGVILLNGITLSVGYFSAKALRVSTKQAATIAIETGMQNNVLGMTIALSAGLLNEPKMAATAGVYGVVMCIIAVGVIFLFKKILNKQNGLTS